jgi:hypothetical protein
MRAFLCTSLMLAAACAKTGALAVVTVDSTTPLTDVPKLHVTAMASGRTLNIDVPLSTPTFPPTHTFGIDLSPSLSGTLSVTLTAIDSNNTTVATASGSATIEPGKRVDLDITFGGSLPDLSVADLSEHDGEIDNDDFAIRPPTFTAQNILASSGAFAAIWAGDATHVWLSGNDSAITYFSAGDDVWTHDSQNPFYPVTGLWGTDATHGWMVDTNANVRILNSVGTIWSSAVALPGTTTPALSAVWGSSATDIWVVSSGISGTVFRNVTGANTVAAWATAHSGDPFGYNAIHGDAPDDIYIVGDKGNIVRADGTSSGYTYYDFGSSTVNLRGVRAIDGTHVYVVGDNGEIGFSTGNGTFTPVTVPLASLTTNFYGIWASSSNDIYVIGANGTLLHSTGGSFTAITTGLEGMSPPHDLTAIWGNGPNDIYIVSNQGDVIHGK